MILNSDELIANEDTLIDALLRFLDAIIIQNFINSHGLLNSKLTENDFEF